MDTLHLIAGEKNDYHHLHISPPSLDLDFTLSWISPCTGFQPVCNQRQNSSGDVQLSFCLAAIEEPSEDNSSKLCTSLPFCCCSHYTYPFTCICWVFLFVLFFKKYSFSFHTEDKLISLYNYLNFQKYSVILNYNKNCKRIQN